MIELKNDALVFSFPEVHPDATLTLDFQRTLRIPDDGKAYPLPPGLGRFPLRHVDDFAERVPRTWLQRGGVMLPMYQAEALWVDFASRFHHSYPFAVKVAAGKINAVTGDTWSNELHRRPQDYLSVPRQPWLDGYCVEKGVIRQFVAMPLGAGYSAEEQLTGEAEHGGIQIVVYPMKRGAYERRFASRRRRARRVAAEAVEMMECAAPAPDMGLAPGGRMEQEIYDDPFPFEEWDLNHRSRCFVHLANSLVWQSIAGQAPPTPPPTAKDYTDAGLPWFDYYEERAKALDGSSKLTHLSSVTEKAQAKGDQPLPENESVTPGNLVHLRANLAPGQVREGRF